MKTDGRITLSKSNRLLKIDGANWVISGSDFG